MSHSGVLLVVRNLGSATCRTSGLPRLRMLDSWGRTLPFVREAPPGMHPGPDVPAVELAPGAQATSALRWVSGAVFDHNSCMIPAQITMTIGRDAATLPWPGGQVCGAAGRPIPFSQPALRTPPAPEP